MGVDVKAAIDEGLAILDDLAKKRDQAFEKMLTMARDAGMELPGKFHIVTYQNAEGHRCDDLHWNDVVMLKTSIAYDDGKLTLRITQAAP